MTTIPPVAEAPFLVLDTETLGLNRHYHAIWEAAAILLDPELAEVARFHWFIEPTREEMADADPTALRLNGFYERSPRVANDATWTPKQLFAVEFAALVAGRHLVAAVPDFDASRLEPLLAAHGECGAWHYHLVDVEAFAAGALGLLPPWNSRDLTTAFGIDRGELDHTAMGDTEWATELFRRAYTGRSLDHQHLNVPEREPEMTDSDVAEIRAEAQQRKLTWGSAQAAREAAAPSQPEPSDGGSDSPPLDPAPADPDPAPSVEGAPQRSAETRDQPQEPPSAPVTTGASPTSATSSEPEGAAPGVIVAAVPKGAKATAPPTSPPVDAEPSPDETPQPPPVRGMPGPGEQLPCEECSGLTEPPEREGMPSQAQISFARKRRILDRRCFVGAPS